MTYRAGRPRPITTLAGAYRTFLPAELLAVSPAWRRGRPWSLLVGLASFLFLARLLSPTGYGTWATVTNATTILVGCAACGLPLATIQTVTAADGAHAVLPTLTLRLSTTALAGNAALAGTALLPGAGHLTLPLAAALPGLVASGLVAGCSDVLRARRVRPRSAARKHRPHPLSARAPPRRPRDGRWRRPSDRARPAMALVAVGVRGAPGGAALRPTVRAGHAPPAPAADRLGWTSDPPALGAHAGRASCAFAWIRSSWVSSAPLGTALALVLGKFSEKLPTSDIYVNFIDGPGLHL